MLSAYIGSISYRYCEAKEPVLRKVPLQLPWYVYKVSLTAQRWTSPLPTHPNVKQRSDFICLTNLQHGTSRGRRTQWTPDGDPDIEPYSRCGGYIRGVGQAFKAQQHQNNSIKTVTDNTTSPTPPQPEYIVKMQLTNFLVLVTAAIGATAAPAGDLQTRATGVKLCKTGGQWKSGWNGAAKSEQYTCSNKGLVVSAFSSILCCKDFAYQTNTLP
jgi:hypothetical protein